MDLLKLTTEEIKQCIKDNEADIRGYEQRIRNCEEFIKEYKAELIYRECGIKIGNVVADDRGTGVVYELQEKYCKASVVKKDGEVGTKILHMYYGNCEKLYDSYEEFKSTVDELARG